MTSCRASARRTKVSSKVAGTRSSAAGTPAASSRRADGGQVGPGYAEVAAHECRRQAGRAERGEGCVPAVGPDGDGGAVADDAGERPLRDDAAVRHQYEAVALAGLVQVVGGDEDAGAAAGRAVDRVPERCPRAEPDAGGGLVQDEQLRSVGQRGCEREATLHAQRQVADERAGGRREVRLERRRQRAEGSGRERQVLGHREILPQPEALRDVAEAASRLPRGRAAEQEDSP